MNSKPVHCRLCLGQANPFVSPRFFHCTQCDCVFGTEEGFLPPSQEKARYQLHQNNPTPAYQRFLSRLMDPLLGEALPGRRGLDFGCGPVPVLGQMLEARGFQVQSFDPYFFPNEQCLQERYDFVTCCETAEHFQQPRKEFELLNGLVKPGGVIAFMTQMRENWDGFSDWYYQRDPTHVVFYSPRTMRWIGKHLGWNPVFFPHSVVIFWKPSR